MNYKHVVLCAIYVWCGSTVWCMECIDDKRVRTFESLVEYQHNNISFNPLKRDECIGNWVKFIDRTEINIIERNAFISLDSKDIWSLDLSKHDVRQIHPEAFLQLDCLYNLNLSSNMIAYIVNDFFVGISHLHVLDLSNNKITQLPDMVFSSLPILKHLNLSRNSVDTIGRDAFFRLNVLNELDLSHNSLFRINETFYHGLYHLEALNLSSNLLSRIYPEYWKNLTSLEVLDLSHNALLSFDVAYDFSFRSSLKFLDLTDNGLSIFNVDAVSDTIGFLSKIGLDENLFSCAALTHILTEFERIHVEVIGRTDVPATHGERPTAYGLVCNKSHAEFNSHKLSFVIGRHFSITDLPPIICKQSECRQDDVVSYKKIWDSKYHDLVERYDTLTVYISCLFVLVIVYVVVEVLAKLQVLGFVWSRFRRIVRQNGYGERHIDESLFNETDNL